MSRHPSVSRVLHPQASRAFTLVELLVVIGIIALLISILVPTLNKARASANTVACMSNLKQLVTATHMFANDHGGFLPKPENNGAATMKGWNTRIGTRWEFSEPMWGWEYALLKYLNKSRGVLRCQADSTDTIRYTWNDKLPNLPDRPEADNVAASYRMNWSNEILQGNTGNYNDTLFVSPKLTQIKPANKALFFFDGVASHADQVSAPANENFVNIKSSDYRYNVWSDNGYNVAFRRHSRNTKDAMDKNAYKVGLANYAFLDGHVETMTFADTWVSLGDNKTPWQVTGFLKGGYHQPK